MRSGSLSENRRQQNIRYLSEACHKGKLSHAYIIEGGKDSGKESFAEEIAAALLCEKTGTLVRSLPEGQFMLEPCGQCPSCIKARTRNHPDIIHVQHEKERVLAVGEIRQQIVADIAIKPYYGPYKIYIVPDAELMNDSAQNALLKTIEEPEEYGILFLLTENADSFLPTIRSRCIKISMGDISREEMGSHLLTEEGESVIQLLKELPDLNAVQINKAAREWEALDRQQILTILQLYFRDVLVYKSTRAADQLYFRTKQQQVCRASENMTYEGLQQAFEALDAAKARLKASVKAEAVYENLMIAIRRCHRGS